MTATTLVTGATGFVGSHVVRHLVERGEGVRALVRASSRRDLLAGLPVEFVEGDLRDPASLERACTGVRRVYHVAADYRLWAADPREIYESNVTGTRNLLEAARRSGVERFVYTSTVATIAVPRPGALPDESTAATVDEMIGHYKRSKFLAEQEAFAAAESGLPVVIVNPSAPVGPRDVKPTPTGRMIVEAATGHMPAFVDTGLNVVHVDDVAEGHVAALRRAPGSTLRPADWWEEALVLCNRPRFFVVGVDHHAVRQRLAARLPLRGESAKVAIYGPCSAGDYARRR